MGKLNIVGEFNFDNFVAQNIIDYNNYKKPLFHGTRRYALEVCEENRQRFNEACNTFCVYAQQLINENKIFPNFVVMGFNNSSLHQYGDFYLTTTYSNAIDFSYLLGGELANSIYDVCLDINERGVEVPNEIKKLMNFIMSEISNYKKSQKVVLVYFDLKFADLYTHGGRRFISDEQLNEVNNDFGAYEKGSLNNLFIMPNFAKQKIDDLYEEKETINFQSNTTFRIKNPEDYKAFLITEEYFRKGFESFTEITDVDKFIKQNNSYVKTKWDF